MEDMAINLINKTLDELNIAQNLIISISNWAEAHKEKGIDEFTRAKNASECKIIITVLRKRLEKIKQLTEGE
jgi:hypothetical protein